MKRRAVRLFLIVMAVGTLAADWAQAADQAPSSDTAKLESEFLPNLVRVHPRVLSGGLPEGDAAFAELADRGVKTVISVDGMTPDVATAKKYGLRYVHLPHGYDGISKRRGQELAKAVRQFDGPVYIHCHHGKHRSPAAASVACVLAGLIPAEQAVAILRLAGTNPHYRGLFQAARAATAVEIETLDALHVEFQEVETIPAIADAMVHLGHNHDHLKRIAEAGWTAPANHPDLVPAHEALMIRERYTELLRTKEVAAMPDDYRRWMQESEAAAMELESALRRWRPSVDSAAPPAKFTQLANRISEKCTACHIKYRDVPKDDR